MADRRYRYVTLDVFTDRRFGGNPLAVVPDARGLTDAEMQSLAAEFNYSETTFVLPPADPRNSARVRIFNRTAEMAFAGHPNVGTACVLASEGRDVGGVLRFEELAGLVEVRVESDAQGAIRGAVIDAPQPLSLGVEIPAETIAACAGVATSDVIVSNHLPTWLTMGNSYVMAELTDDAVSRATPYVEDFRRALAEHPMPDGRFSLYVYARNAEQVHARMFAPLAGTHEDPATGSAAAPLAGLLLSLSGDAEANVIIRQGAEMRRPSVLHARAWRAPEGIRASVGGGCVTVMKGEIRLG
ncbi:MAG: Phenazine biosynthesis protein PhzF [Gemmatimonadetes bacterium]|nr:Phenazine biosynthesis protein PhzF [Gemmatimonadota bacterium]